MMDIKNLHMRGPRGQALGGQFAIQVSVHKNKSNTTYSKIKFYIIFFSMMDILVYYFIDVMIKTAYTGSRCAFLF